MDEAQWREDTAKEFERLAEMVRNGDVTGFFYAVDGRDTSRTGSGGRGLVGLSGIVAHGLRLMNKRIDEAK